MISRGLSLRQTVHFSEGFDVFSVDPFETSSDTLCLSSKFDIDTSKSTIEALRRLLKRLEKLELPGKDHIEAYLSHVSRRNRRPKTLESLWGAIVVFLKMIKESGKTRLEDLARGDLEAFIEHEQDRGIKITTLKTKLVCVQAFLHYLVEEGIVTPDVFGRRIRLQLPERLPRAMDSDDLRLFLSVIDHVRDRAMILVLVRTGMRIGELLKTKMTDVNLKERRIEIYEAEKNRLGRVVYLSDDAVSALEAWFKKRDPWKDYTFYAEAKSGMCYSTARSRFVFNEPVNILAGSPDEGHAFGRFAMIDEDGLYLIFRRVFVFKPRSAESRTLHQEHIDTLGRVLEQLFE